MNPITMKPLFSRKDLSIPELLSLEAHLNARARVDTDDVSTSSYQSYDSLASGVSLVPFFFTEIPKLPHVDQHINSDNLKFEALRSNQDPNKIIKPRKRRKKGIMRKSEISAAVYRARDIKYLLQYVDSCGNSNGEISLDEFDLAIRKFKYAKILSEDEDIVKVLFLKLVNLFDIAHVSEKEWFRSCHGERNNSILGGQVRITWPIFQEQINRLCRGNFVDEFGRNDFLVLQRFIDPMAEFDDNNELSETEFVSAFKRIKTPTAMTATMEGASLILTSIDEYMRKMQVRVRDVFNFMNRGASVNLRQLALGIELIMEALNYKKVSSTVDKSALHPISEHREIRNFARQEVMGSITREKKTVSSGYGYGKIKINKNTSTGSFRRGLPELLSQAEIAHSLGKTCVPDKEKLKALVDKKLRLLYGNKLDAIDDTISLSIHKAWRDLSVRPGNNSCLNDGSYLNIQGAAGSK
jgi:hypothetical protein